MNGVRQNQQGFSKLPLQWIVVLLLWNFLFKYINKLIIFFFMVEIFIYKSDTVKLTA